MKGKEQNRKQRAWKYQVEALYYKEKKNTNYNIHKNFECKRNFKNVNQCNRFYRKNIVKFKLM